MIEHVLLKDTNDKGEFVVEKWEDGVLVGSVAFATRMEAIIVTRESCSRGSNRSLRYE